MSDGIPREQFKLELGFGETEAHELMTRILDRMARTQATCKEFLATCFLNETGYRPSECELVQRQVGTEVRWYFRKREPEKSDVNRTDPVEHSNP